jgi:hypothetical protein
MKIAKLCLTASIALIAAIAAAQTNTFPASGNVGIGTTSPQSTLDVNGNINYVTLTAGIGAFSAPPGTGYYYVGSLPNAGTSVMQHLYVEVLGGSWVAQGLTRWACNAYGGSVKCTRLNDSYAPDVSDIVAYLDSSNNYDFYVSTNVSGGWPSFAISAKLFDGTNYRTVNVVSTPSPNGVQQPISLTAGPSLVQGGNVGIGTTSPGALLEVNGHVKLTAGSGASLTFQDGSVQTVAWNGTLSGGDYAESVDVTGDRKQYEPGDVLVIDPVSPGKFLKCATAYSTSVAGIYSTKPGIRGRRQKSDSSHMNEEVPLAMVGVVPTKVSAESGSIHPGDLIVTSSKPGYAMKGIDRTRITGAIVGKAMGNLDSGTGVMEVLVSLQ